MEVDEFLEHHGIKGMHWGIRNDRKPSPSGFRSQTSAITVDQSIHSKTRESAKKISSLISDRYGFHITEVKDLKVENPKEYANGSAAFVKSTPGKSEGVIFVKPDNLDAEMKISQSTGFMAPGTTNALGLFTHESAHAMFHADQTTKGVFVRRVVGSHQAARDKALAAAQNQATRDGIAPDKVLSKISGYAKYSGTREEVEAEMFSQYHWGTSTPKFIQVWGETLHHEMGIDPTPFKKVVKRG